MAVDIAGFLLRRPRSRLICVHRLWRRLVVLITPRQKTDKVPDNPNRGVRGPHERHQTAGEASVGQERPPGRSEHARPPPGALASLLPWPHERVDVLVAVVTSHGACTDTYTSPASEPAASEPAASASADSVTAVRLVPRTAAALPRCRHLVTGRRTTASEDGRQGAV